MLDPDCSTLPDVPPVKTCSKCGETKPAGDFQQKSRRCRDCRSQYCREWRAKNEEHHRAYDRAYYAANKQRLSATWKAYYAKNADRLRENHRDWLRTHPDAGRQHKQIRRARQLSSPAIERISRAALWERDGGKCHICGKRCDPNDWHADHLIPLSRGGAHTMNNLAVAHPSCNHRRYNTGPAQLRLID